MNTLSKKKRMLSLGETEKCKLIKLNLKARYKTQFIQTDKLTERRTRKIDRNWKRDLVGSCRKMIDGPANY
jgi:hypothetical protein